jgi:hypothetical protein
MQPEIESSMYNAITHLKGSNTFIERAISFKRMGNNIQGSQGNSYT